MKRGLTVGFAVFMVLGLAVAGFAWTSDWHFYGDGSIQGKFSNPKAYMQFDASGPWFTGSINVQDDGGQMDTQAQLEGTNVLLRLYTETIHNYGFYDNHSIDLWASAGGVTAEMNVSVNGWGYGATMSRYGGDMLKATGPGYYLNMGGGLRDRTSNEYSVLANFELYGSLDPDAQGEIDHVDTWYACAAQGGYYSFSGPESYRAPTTAHDPADFDFLEIDATGGGMLTQAAQANGSLTYIANYTMVGGGHTGSNPFNGEPTWFFNDDISGYGSVVGYDE